jgi:tetratricopeptide (TPR) repeat protein
MPLSFRKPLSLLILSLSFVIPALGQSQTVSKSNASPDVKNLAVALARVKTEAEQEQLLAENVALQNESLLSALRALAEPFIQKGDYNEALRITHLALRIAERSGDRRLIAILSFEVGSIYARRNPPKEATAYLQKSLTIFEERGDKKGQAQALHSMAYAYDTERRVQYGVEYVREESGAESGSWRSKLTALIFNGLGMAHTNRWATMRSGWSSITKPAR